MEKYRKFDDPSNGLNPFTPLEVPKKFEGWKKGCRFLLSVFFVLLRLPLLILCMFVFLSLHSLKYLLLIPRLIRWMECFTDSLIGQIVMTTCSIQRVKEMYHREHEKYDFAKL
jgi:hypothetical protein